MKINVQLDERSIRQLNYFNGFLPHWEEHLYRDMAEHLAKVTVERIKPYTKAKRSFSTGESEQSVRSDINVSGNGFDIHFFGNLGAFYMDEGNFAPNDELWAPKGNVKEAFPIDSRFGQAIYSPVIHGMGHHTNGVPTHYSEKVANWLEGDGLEEAYMDSMRKWFDSVVAGG